LESFYPYSLSNIKQGQIDVRKCCERQVERTYNKTLVRETQDKLQKKILASE